jgi:purine-nucleoside phosphorylase
VSAPAAVAALRAAGLTGPFDLAVVTGTGLGALAERIEDARAVPYAAIPGFSTGGVSGHVGRFVAGRLSGARIAVLQGRVHAYERGEADAMRVPLAALAELGCGALLLTNASGSLLPQAGPGSLVALSDHLNLSGLNPLVGEPSEARFVPMVGAYDAALRAALQAAARAAGVTLHEGVYAWFCGPSFETPAEVRMAGRLGADLVGMSTVPETILARFLGLRVAAVSLVTNHAAGLSGGDPSHAETKAVAAAGAEDLARLVTAFAARLATAPVP